jgi:carbamate kinase
MHVVSDRTGRLMRVVIALGRNALLRRGEPADAETQRRHVAAAARSLAELAEQHDVIVSHGNGPQVGLLALQAEAYREVAPYPLDVLGAESEGMIGYLLEQGLRNELPEREIATLLTEVIVDAGDPAFEHPTKPVGPAYEEAAARALSEQRGWTVAPDGDHWRRVVPSPEPRRIVGLGAIRRLADAGVLVICVGGGGIPVVEDPRGGTRGAAAVIDKDLAAALLARELGADALLLLTDVAGVELDHGTPAARTLREARPAALRELALPAGSMRPKAEAAARFVEAGGRLAVICALEDATAALAGKAGTLVRAPNPEQETLAWKLHWWDFVS